VPCPGIPLELNLEYQSVTTQPEGLLGKDWLHSYEWFLSIEENSAVLYTGTGNKYFFQKDSAGYLYTDEWGEVIVQTDDTAGYLSPSGNSWKLERVETGYRVTLPGGRFYNFDAAGWLKSINDAWGNQVTCSYDIDNCLQAVTHSNGRRIEFNNQWDSTLGTWRIGNIVVPDGAELTFNYTDEGQIAEIIEQVGGQSVTSRYQYGNGYLTNKVDAAGHQYSFGYESNGAGGFTGKGTRLNVDGYYEHTVTYVTSNLTDVAYSTRGQSQIYRYSRDTSNTLQNIYGPAASAQNIQTLGKHFVYSGADKIEETQFDNAAGGTWSTYMQYDSFHNVTNFAVAYSSSIPIQQARIQYDPVWQLPTSVTDPEGNRTETVYVNGLPQVKKEFWANTQSYDTYYGYNPKGLLTAVRNANNHMIQCTYDGAGNLSTAFAEVGPVVSNGYNSLGFVTRTEMLTESGASSERITQYERDAKGNVLKTTYADGLTSSNSYNVLDYLTNTIDRAGRVTELTYAPTKKLTSVTRYLEENGSNTPVRMAYDYDQQFNTLRITEPRGRYVESYRLDIQDRITAVTNIEGQTMTVDYGIGDFVKKITRFDGSTVSNVYDVAGRNSSVIYRSPSGQHLSTISRSYYADGQPKTVSDGTSTISNTYDRLNRLVGSSSIMGSLYSAVTNAYDPVGNITGSTVYLGGSRSVAGSYRYDAAERLTNITVAAGVTQSFAYAYSPVNGRIATITNAQSGITTTYAYDLMDYTTNISYRTASGTLIRSLDYQYDALGMITNRVISGGMGSVETAYRYDTINRLVNETTGNDPIDYQYDLAGNRTAVIDNGITNTYTLGIGDRLASVTGTSGSMVFSYDAAGNTTNITTGSSTQKLTWDEKYQLTSVTSATSSVSYSYDVLGRRAGRVAGTSAERYVYNGNQVAADLDANGNLLRTYTWGPGIDNMLSMTVHGASVTNTYYALKDQQNSVMAMVDASGNVVESYVYDAYGRTKIFDSNGSELTRSAVGNRYMWQGREFDATTGLYFFRARWYSPETGRWISKDPIGISGGLNIYAFCANNPVNFIDPVGCCGNASGNFRENWYRQSESMFNFFGAIIFALQGNNELARFLLEQSKRNSGYQILKDANAPPWAYSAYAGAWGASGFALGGYAIGTGVGPAVFEMAVRLMFHEPIKPVEMPPPSPPPISLGL
jgi:RHS repeat-associated protein